MEPSPAGEHLLDSPSIPGHPTTFTSIPTSNFLKVPKTGPSGTHFLPGPHTVEEETDSFPLPRHPSIQRPRLFDPAGIDIIEPVSVASSSRHAYLRNRTYMSVYSSTSAESEYSVYSNPPARTYRLPSFQDMSASRKVSAVRPIRSSPDCRLTTPRRKRRG